MGKVEELTRTLEQLQRILSSYPEMMEAKQMQRLEFIQRCVNVSSKKLDYLLTFTVRIFEEAKATVGTQQGKTRVSRLFQGTDDQTKLVETLGKLTRFVNLLQVCQPISAIFINCSY